MMLKFINDTKKFLILGGFKTSDTHSIKNSYACEHNGREYLANH